MACLNETRFVYSTSFTGASVRPCSCAIALLTAIRFALSPIVGTTSPFILYLPAIILCAWFGGLWLDCSQPLSALLSVCHFFVAPYYTFQFSDPKVLAQLVIFLFVGALISSLGRKLAAIAKSRRSQRDKGTGGARAFSGHARQHWRRGHRDGSCWPVSRS